MCYNIEYEITLTKHERLFYDGLEKFETLAGRRLSLFYPDLPVHHSAQSGHGGRWFAGAHQHPCIFAFFPLWAGSFGGWNVAQKQKDYDITIVVTGGGLAGQVDAIKLAISKAITLEAPDLRPVLKKAGFIKRDPREKERKKYGLRSARKKEKFSKR